MTEQILKVDITSSILSVSIKEFEEMEKDGIQMDITNPIFKKALQTLEKEVRKDEREKVLGLMPVLNPSIWTGGDYEDGYKNATTDWKNNIIKTIK